MLLIIPSSDSFSVPLIDSSGLPSQNVARLLQYRHISVTGCETFKTDSIVWPAGTKTLKMTGCPHEEEDP